MSWRGWLFALWAGLWASTAAAASPGGETVAAPGETVAPASAEERAKPPKPNKKARKKKKKKKRKKKKRKKKKTKPWLVQPDLTRRWGWLAVTPEMGAFVEGGMVYGLGMRNPSGAQLGLGVDGGFLLSAPYAWFEPTVRYAQVHTFGYPQPQRDLALEAEAGLGPFWGAKGYSKVGYRRMYRPGWNDLYQPLVDDKGDPTGAFTPTDRYSTTSVAAEAGLDVAHPLGESGLFVDAARRLNDHDPGFDPILAPNHLVPNDRTEVGGGVKTKGDLWARRLRYRVAGHVEYRAYDLRLARDHHTGKTNASPGGLPQNPPLKEWRAQLRSRQSFWVKSAKLRLSTSVSYTYNLDLYDGYMSWHRVVGKIGARWRPLRGLALSASWRSAFRLFEDTGYKEGGAHPALDDEFVFGRRHDEAHTLEAEAAYAIFKGLVEFYAGTEMSARFTNFPDYTPYTFPARRAYSLDRDVRLFTAYLGLRVQM